MVTAPQAAARLRISAPGGATATVAVPAGRTVNVDLRAALHAGTGGPGPLLLTPLDGLRSTSCAPCTPPGLTGRS